MIFLFLSLPWNNIRYQDIILIANVYKFDVVNPLLEFKQQCYNIFDLIKIYRDTLAGKLFSLLN